MEQRYKEQTRTVSKQYGPMVEAVLSCLLVIGGVAFFVISHFV